MVRESTDLSCVLFAATGSSLAQGRFSQPWFTGTAPQTLYHMPDKFPPQTLEPGDVVVTNDPWQGTGHLFDINVMRPVFRGERHVGFTMSVTHLPDIGGTGFTATTREVLEEGLNIPIMKREQVADSDGAGESRGGLAQNIVIRNDTGNPLSVACFGGRTEFAPEGYQGGRAGSAST